MTEHKSTAFAHSCVKVPVDPYSHQPSPLYKRPERPITAPARCLRRNTCVRMDNRCSPDLENACDEYASIGELLDGAPPFEEERELSSEQYRQKIDYLKRKQRILLKDLRNCLEQDENEKGCRVAQQPAKSARAKSAGSKSYSGLALKGKRYNLDEPRANSPRLYPPGDFSCLAEDQDFLTYRCKEREKAAKTRRNEAILAGASKTGWTGSSSESKSSAESDELEISGETKSLPTRSPQRSHPTTPKPFSYRDCSKKYMTAEEQQAVEKFLSGTPGKKNPAKKRRIRPVPLTSKIPLYDKLLAEKEERSRLVREVSALSLMSQVRPFRLECDRRALRAFTRSSPELSARKIRSQIGARFRARPVPRSLFSNDVYDRMLDDEYFRNLQKRIRSVELLKSSSLPPSMARRERCKSAVSSRSHKSSSEERTRSSTTGRDSVALNRGTPLISERSRSSAIASTLPPNGTNLAAILRAQASREKLERDLHERVEEKRREQMLRLRKAMIGRKPAWRALRSAARHEHERDLDFRASLRRVEAREQAERHRLQMEMMVDRVTQIPMLFERYSQSYRRQRPTDEQESGTSKKHHHHHHHHHDQEKRRSCSSTDSYASLMSSSRPDSGSLTSSSAPTTCCPSSVSERKKRTDRGPLKVSINETAELIEDSRHLDDETGSVDSQQAREEREKRVLGTDPDENPTPEHQ